MRTSPTTARHGSAAIRIPERLNVIMLPKQAAGFAARARRDGVSMTEAASECLNAQLDEALSGISVNPQPARQARRASGPWTSDRNRRHRWDLSSPITRAVLSGTPPTQKDTAPEKRLKATITFSKPALKRIQEIAKSGKRSLSRQIEMLVEQHFTMEEASPAPGPASTDPAAAQQSVPQARATT